MTRTADDHYDILQLRPDATAAAVRAAYRALAQRNHPDKHPSDPQRAAERMQRLNAAYEVLSDPVRRAAYDAQRAPAADVLQPPADFQELVEEAERWWQASAPAPLTPSTPPPPTPQPVVVPDPPREDRWRPIALVSLALMVVVASVGWWVWRAATHQPAPLAPLKAHTAQATLSGPPLAPDAAKRLYEQTARALEAQHPALNPRSPQYRKDLVAQAKARAQTYVQQGQPAHLALQLAVQDLVRLAEAQRKSPQLLPGVSEAQRIAIGVACGEAPTGEALAAYQACARRVLSDAAR